MPRYREIFTLNISRSHAQRACSRAVTELGWRLEGHGAHGLLCTGIEQASASAWPLQVEIVLAEDTTGETNISLYGFYGGWGPIESGYVQREVRTLRACIEKIARPVLERQLSLRVK